MLLSVSVWSGAEAATRDLFHWVSALIALPAIAYAGRPFFRSAWRALAAASLNMDVPISLAVLLAAAMSLYETAAGGANAWFDASVTLVFFLLVGRYLDHLMRARARSVAAELLALQAAAATVVGEDGTRRAVRAEDLAAGQVLVVAPGERLAADGRVESGVGDIDRSMVTGETVPETVRPGDLVHAGTLNLSGSLRVQVTAAGERTFLAEIVRLMETAEQGRAAYVRIADRAARIYAPAVHLAALATFIGWLVLAGDVRQAMLAAVAVLIITCPCALGLAVPAVQVAASGVLMRLGVLVRSGDALERLARADTAVFDKTGTLTLGRPVLASAASDGTLGTAAALAGESRHPLARALVLAAEERGLRPPAAGAVAERPGEGMEGIVAGRPVRLGQRVFAGAAARAGEDDGYSEIWLADGDAAPFRFAFEDTVRADAGAAVADLKARGFEVRLLSGDWRGPVARLARSLGLDDYAARATPDAKLAAVEALRASGRHVLMVGDGINDAPALAAADVSMSPATAADVSQVKADFVFMGERLAPVVAALDVARTAERLVRQNFAIAIAYNLVAVPIAVAGLATPLLAAIAMSTSSLLVTANAMRVRLAARRGDSPASAASRQTARPGPARRGMGPEPAG
jgi:Cu2+-exporting ATPase